MSVVGEQTKFEVDPEAVSGLLIAGAEGFVGIAPGSLELDDFGQFHAIDAYTAGVEYVGAVSAIVAWRTGPA